MSENYLYFSENGEKTVKILDNNGDWVKAPSSKQEDEVFEYPTTARRAFVNLAEAVRTVNEDHSMRDMLVAIAGLHMDEDSRQTVLMTYLANIPHRVSFSPVHRQNLAESLARLLEGQEKFHAGRFIHHATSDSTADDDGKGGKWSYNRLNPEDAQRTTIESVPEEGDGETVIL